MLELLGVKTFDETVYRWLLRLHKTTIGAIAAAMDVPPQRVQAAVARLRALGLAAYDDGAVRATDPRIPLGTLTRERLNEVHQAWAVVEELAGLYAAGELRSSSARLTTILEGTDSVTQWFNNLVSSAQRQILVLDAPPHSSRGETTGSGEQDMVERGVEIKVIYAASALDPPGRLERVFADIAAGEQARVMPEVPYKLLIVDAACALLPLEPHAPDPSQSVIVVQKSGLVDALVHHFELLWQQARPITAPGEPSQPWTGETPTEEELALLRLLDAGLTEDAIARNLGVSARTFRRRMTVLMARLDAGSRFQAGARAKQRGWI